MNTPNYHGPMPVTPKDKKMAKKHLNDSKQLLQSKIADHESAKEDAAEGGNEASESYNNSHLVSHKKDLQGVNKSLNTLATQIGGSMTNQPIAKEKSPALAAYITKKKYGAKMMSKLASKKS